MYTDAVISEKEKSSRSVVRRDEEAPAGYGTVRRTAMKCYGLLNPGFNVHENVVFRFRQKARGLT